MLNPSFKKTRRLKKNEGDRLPCSVAVSSSRMRPKPAMQPPKASLVEAHSMHALDGKNICMIFMLAWGDCRLLGLLAFFTYSRVTSPSSALSPQPCLNSPPRSEKPGERLLHLLRGRYKAPNICVSTLDNMRYVYMVSLPASPTRLQSYLSICVYLSIMLNVFRSFSRIFSPS